jgi:hypothetical protein
VLMQQSPDSRQRQQRQQSGNRKIGNVIYDGEIDQRTKENAGITKHICLVSSISRRVGVPGGNGGWRQGLAFRWNI